MQAMIPFSDKWYKLQETFKAHIYYSEVPVQEKYIHSKNLSAS